MAAFVFNQSKGRMNEFARRVNGNDPANSALVLVLFKGALVSTTDALKDMDTLTVIKAAEVECDFTNYARIVLTDTDIVDPVVDDTGNLQSFDIADQTIVAAGGATNNSVAMLVVCYDADTTAGTDADIIPIAAYIPASAETTNGEDFHIRVHASGLWSAGDPA